MVRPTLLVPETTLQDPYLQIEEAEVSKFLITNYAMGTAISRVEVEGTLTDAILRAERLESHGQPGTGKGAAARSRVIGIQRVK